jgi:acetoin utilization protein AcuB
MPMTSLLFDQDIVPIYSHELNIVQSELNCYPVINKSQEFQGVIDSSCFIDPKANDIKAQHHAIISHKPSVWEAISILKSIDSNVLIVIDAYSKYVGTITYSSIIQELQGLDIMTSNDSLLELSIPNQRFSMVELIQLIQSENADIRSFYKNVTLDGSHIILILNTRDLRPIIGALEDKDYNIVSTVNEEGYSEILNQRYHHLINYINI